MAGWYFEETRKEWQDTDVQIWKHSALARKLIISRNFNNVSDENRKCFNFHSNDCWRWRFTFAKNVFELFVLATALIDDQFGAHSLIGSTNSRWFSVDNSLFLSNTHSLTLETFDFVSRWKKKHKFPMALHLPSNYSLKCAISNSFKRAKEQVQVQAFRTIFYILPWKLQFYISIF